MLSDQIVKIAVQILKPEPAPNLSQFVQPWAPPPSFVTFLLLAFRGAGRADRYGPFPVPSRCRVSSTYVVKGWQDL